VPSTPDPGASRARHEVADCLVRSFTLLLYTTRACHLLHIARFVNGMRSTTVVFILLLLQILHSCAGHTCHPLARSKRSHLFWPPPFYRLSLLLAVSGPVAGSCTSITPSSVSAVFSRHFQNLAFFLCIHQQPPPISTTPCHSSAAHCCWLTSVINPALARHLNCYVLIACILRVCHLCLWVYDVHTVL
jgi:hypothetical protein